MSKFYCSLGLMSGTSGDGVDASVIQSDGDTEYEVILDEYFEYNQAIYKNIHNLKDKINNSKDIKNFSKEIESLQKEIMIAFEALTLPPNPDVYAYSSFDVVVKNVKNGSTIERFSGCNMDPNSQNYVARRIGDMYQEWDYTEKRWKAYGDYVNVSSYIRIIMADSLPEQKAALPFGFLGPARPKGFAIMDDDSSPKSFDLGSDFAGAFVKRTRTDLSNDFIEHSVGNLAVKFKFPEIPIRNSGTDGFAANPYKAMYGIRPKIDSKSNLYDNDYTMWQDNSLNCKDGWLEFNFLNEIYIEFIVVQNAEKSSSFKRNYKVRDLLITGDDPDLEIQKELENDNFEQWVDVNTNTTFLRIDFLSTYPGEELNGQNPFDECAIQEIRFFGKG